VADILVPNKYCSAALEASHIVKTAKGVVYGISAYNGNGAARFIQLFDSTTLPADAVVPLFTFQVAAGATLLLTFPGVGIQFYTGVVVCNSSTGGAKTIGAADSLFQILFG
jgi:hypothetical protein